MQLEKYVRQIEEEVIAIRRYLHKHPELSNQEKETSKYVEQKLSEYEIPFETGFATYGVLGIIKGGYPGKTVALRADMDALPIQERNDHDFVSENLGAMHACGHDAHTAMLLGAGYVLKQVQEEINGTILLVFQPAEEDSPVGGAGVMMEDGVFDRYKPDVIYGQHVWPYIPFGTVGIHDCEIMGASERFKIKIKGQGGHASMPHQTTDVIVAAGHLITSLQTIVSRSLDPLHASVVTIGVIHGGSVPNIIPNEVVLEGSIRTYNEDIRKKLKDRFFMITNQVVEAFEARAEIEYNEGYPATINTPKWAGVARKSARKVIGENATPTYKPSLAGEDFGRYLQHYPGAFIWLGTQIENKEEQAPLHDANFKLNERALSYGTELLAQIAVDTLNELKIKEG